MFERYIEELKQLKTVLFSEEFIDELYDTAEKILRDN
jgi:hypothetical protein